MVSLLIAERHLGEGGSELQQVVAEAAMAVDLRLTRAEQIEIGTVDYQYHNRHFSLCKQQYHTAEVFATEK